MSFSEATNFRNVEILEGRFSRVNTKGVILITETERSIESSSENDNSAEEPSDVEGLSSDSNIIEVDGNLLAELLNVQWKILRKLEDIDRTISHIGYNKRHRPDNGEDVGVREVIPSPKKMLLHR